MRKYLTGALLALGLAGSAGAAPITYTAVLTGAAENPPTGSLGTGTVTVVIDADAHTLAVSADFADLTGPTTAAHIHCCIAAPGNVSVATETPSFTGFPLGVTDGSFSNTFDLTLASSWNAPFITANGGTTAAAETALLNGLANGQAYFNVHTGFSPGGEIRGFLMPAAAPVPEPASLALLGFGLAGAALRRRRTH